MMKLETNHGEARLPGGQRERAAGTVDEKRAGSQGSTGGKQKGTFNTK